MKSVRFRIIATLAATLAVVGGIRSLIFCDETETVIVTQFGAPVRTLDEPGLYFKPPYQSTIRIDRRLQIYDPPPSEFLASEPVKPAVGESAPDAIDAAAATDLDDADSADARSEIGMNVNLDVWVLWRVDDPSTFLKTVGDPTGAESRIHDVVFSELAAEVGRNPLEALASVDDETHRLDELVGQVSARCADHARTAYGIEIVDVNLRRIGLPAQSRESVFNRMRKERLRMAERFRAEGEGEALKIRAAADKQRTIALAKADAEARQIRGRAEAEAIKIEAAARRQDPEFYLLMRTLEAYKTILDKETTILLSADSDLLKYFMRGPELTDPPTPK